MRTRPTPTPAAPVTGNIEAYNSETGMSSSASGGNAEAMGPRGRGMGHDAVHGHGEHVQDYNRDENPVSGPQGGTTEPLGLCPEGTVALSFVREVIGHRS